MERVLGWFRDLRAAMGTTERVAKRIAFDLVASLGSAYGALFRSSGLPTGVAADVWDVVKHFVPGEYVDAEVGALYQTHESEELAKHFADAFNMSHPKPAAPVVVPADVPAVAPVEAPAVVPLEVPPAA